MPTLDSRRGALDITATTNTVTEVETTWLDGDGDPWMLTGHEVRMWVGGAASDGGTFTGATEVTPTVVDNVATFTIPAQARSTTLRLAIDGELVALGRLSVVSNGTATPVTSVSVAVDSADGALTLTVGSGPLLSATTAARDAAVAAADSAAQSAQEAADAVLALMSGGVTGLWAGATLPEPRDPNTLYFVHEP